jgi:DNA repair exonuclease SbcCD ATPase subunit
VPEGPLAVLRELERADEEIGAELAGLERLAAELDEIRAKAQDLQAFAARLPAERERRRGEVVRARAEVAEADRAVAEAEESVRTAKPDGAREAELFAVRARDRLSVAERRAAEAGKAAADLENAASEATAESEALRARALKLAADLRGRPRIAEDAGKEPGTGLDGVAAWGEAARAALFVARSQLAAERDAVIRQANEIGALALGEPLTAMGTGALARRVERAVSRGDA